jgi:Protein of unknown function (DUF3455)
MRNMAWIVTTGILLCMRTSAVNADQTAVAPPQSSSLLLEVMADGVQIYTCEAKGSGGGFEWSFKAPEASLFDQQGRQIGIHFAGPSWKITDGSEVVGEAVAKADAPDPGAIQWLLLRAKSHEGSGALSGAAYIRRIETKGGLAPKTGCDASHLSAQARMRYSASYQFLSAGKK